MISSTWKPLTPDIDAFLAEYERRSAESSSDAGAHFAEQFLAIDPSRALVLTRATLVAVLPARRRMFEDAGVGAIRRAGASQLELDERHLLISVDWDAERTGGGTVRLESTFLVRREEGGPSILVYLNHNDVAAQLSPADR